MTKPTTTRGLGCDLETLEAAARRAPQLEWKKIARRVTAARYFGALDEQLDQAEAELARAGLEEDAGEALRALERVYRRFARAETLLSRAIEALCHRAEAEGVGRRRFACELVEDLVAIEAAAEFFAKVRRARPM